MGHQQLGLRPGERGVEAFDPVEAVLREPVDRLEHLLFVADRARSEHVEQFKRCFELFDGRDEAAVADTRERWKAYKAAGHAVVYWQQTASGGWEKKA